MENVALTPKQQRFCDEYLIDMNATAAALRAGYSSSTALGGALMRIPKIAYYLQGRTAVASHEAQVTHKMILTELSKIAFGNMRNCYRSDGTLKGLNEMTDDEAAALWSVRICRTDEGESTIIRMHSKLGALEKLARHLKFYSEPEAEPQSVVFVDTANLTEDDKLDDDSFDEEEGYNEEDDDLDSYCDETEEEHEGRMTSERQNLVHFYPRLEKMLPLPRYLTDEMIVYALRELVTPSHQEPWYLADKRMAQGDDALVPDPTKPILFEQEDGTVSWSAYGDSGSLE